MIASLPSQEEFKHSINAIQKRLLNMPETPEPVYLCTTCRDTGWVFMSGNRAKECDCRKKKSLEGKMMRMGINPKKVKGLSDFKPLGREHSRALLSAMDFVGNFRKSRTYNGLLLCGQSGTGKTHIAHAVIKNMLEKTPPVNVGYMPYIDVMGELKSLALEYARQTEIRGQYQKAELLVIEDMFKDIAHRINMIPAADVKQMYAILNYREMNDLPIVITTELTPGELATMDAALYRRMENLCKGAVFTFTKDHIWKG